ncbi:hypothetical protein WRSd3_p00170 (plasmid) [Shigella dysenteriae WRSd3]|uniref:Uncharacterized protein n=1 Tax=Shigella dysenteriae WRSd3 TaxID=1401327 RepID=A0A090NVG9_SHIDY|nr:hypothetical protein WRSd3_p00170 [Shigella dysenteriae WRSd3]ESU76697.1 hypothetical protein WRSd5_p00144 [Shigella dysenteriae WRSd5]
MVTNKKSTINRLRSQYQKSFKNILADFSNIITVLFS